MAWVLLVLCPTIIMAILKFTGHTDIGWGWVFSPILAVLYLLMAGGLMVMARILTMENTETGQTENKPDGGQ